MVLKSARSIFPFPVWLWSWLWETRKTHYKVPNICQETIWIEETLTRWGRSFHQTQCYEGQTRNQIPENCLRQKLLVKCSKILMKYIKNSIVQDILVIRIVKIKTNFMTSPVLFNFLLLAGNLKVGEPMLCCLFLSNSTQIHSKEAFIIKHEG